MLFLFQKKRIKCLTKEREKRYKPFVPEAQKYGFRNCSLRDKEKSNEALLKKE